MNSEFAVPPVLFPRGSASGFTDCLVNLMLEMVVPEIPLPQILKSHPPFCAFLNDASSIHTVVVAHVSEFDLFMVACL